MTATRIKPLAGVRVVDLSRIVAGPYCTQQMADLGAEVIKVEPPGGDDTRRFGPPFLGDDATYYFSINRGKRSIAINLKTEAGKKIVFDLVKDADVVVENFRPGAAKRLGIDSETLRSLNPRLIYVSISGYGAHGAEPWTSMPGYDLIIQGAGGIPSLTGPVDGGLEDCRLLGRHYGFSECFWRSHGSTSSPRKPERVRRSISACLTDSSHR